MKKSIKKSSDTAMPLNQLNKSNKSIAYPIFICTFGYAHDHYGFYQPIEAPNEQIASQMMMKKYGKKWAFSYELSFFEELRKQGFFVREQALPILRMEWGE